MESSKAKKRFGIIAVSLVICLLLCICVLLVVLLFKKDDNPGNVIEQTTTKKREYVVNKDNVEEIKEELKETVPAADAYYTVTMNDEWKFSSDTYESKNAYVANSTANKRTVYFNVIVPATGEVVYSSPFIPVGGELRGFKLDKPLPKGEQTVWVEYHLVDENENELTTLTVAISIVVR